ncbi:unnamed protein product [Protopolystoma xenopodis]|uniref:UBC core domain-containing protein n=1 Tax=Protopolystoma xenopodis TaxID=117903 RepID=A0A3S5AC70_9PLAT|nr:unnamed protein product [Protopolystoma xenopodis]
MASGSAFSCAVKTLQKELKELNEYPVEGFRVNLADENSLFVWDVAIFGPPQTLYEGGYFKVILSLIFIMFHPNIYENGEVCISILHPPEDDPHSGELASERWNPTQNVSVISLLNEPNINSAAYVDASVAYRNWKESGGREKEYETTVRSFVELSQAEAVRDGVQVPRTIEEYCQLGRSNHEKSKVDNNVLNDRGFADFVEDDDDYCFCVDDDDCELDADEDEICRDKFVERQILSGDALDSTPEEQPVHSISLSFGEIPLKKTVAESGNTYCGGREGTLAKEGSH